MKRIYACIVIVAALLAVSFYSSFQVQKFADTISVQLDTAIDAIRAQDYPTARQALADGADRCDQMRTGMNHLLRTADFTELEAALRASDGHLEMTPRRRPSESCAGRRCRWKRWNGSPGGWYKKHRPPALSGRGPVKKDVPYFWGSLRSPMSFCSSLKKLSTSANWR